MKSIIILLTTLLAVTSAFSGYHFNVRGRIISRRPSSSLLRMSDNKAADEAAKLLEQARKLREEAAQMSGSSVEDEQVKQEEVKSKAVISADGTYYDDEIEPVRKDPLSADMRARLIREANTGLDSESKQTNVILYISIVVGILVVLGGQGILY